MRAASMLFLVTLTSPPGVSAAPDSCPDNLATGDRCAPGQSDVGAAPGAELPSTSLGNPIDLVTGSKSQTETDLSIDGAVLVFRRHYQPVLR